MDFSSRHRRWSSLATARSIRLAMPSLHWGPRTALSTGLFGHPGECPNSVAIVASPPCLPMTSGLADIGLPGSQRSCCIDLCLFRADALLPHHSSGASRDSAIVVDGGEPATSSASTSGGSFDDAASYVGEGSVASSAHLPRAGSGSTRRNNVNLGMYNCPHGNRRHYCPDCGGALVCASNTKSEIKTASSATLTCSLSERLAHTWAIFLKHPTALRRSATRRCTWGARRK